MDRLVRGRGHPGHAVRHPLGRPGPRVLRRRTGRGPALQRVCRLGGHRRGCREAGDPPDPVAGVQGGAARRGPGQGPGDPRTGLPDHTRGPRRGLRHGGAVRRTGRRGARPHRPGRPSGPPRPAGAGRGRPGARPGRLHLADTGADHGHRRVVPRARCGRGGHGHAGARGVSLRVTGRLPPGASPPSGGDGDDPGPELVPRRVGRCVRGRRPLRIPPGRHAAPLHQRSGFAGQSGGRCAECAECAEEGQLVGRFSSPADVAGSAPIPPRPGPP